MLYVMVFHSKFISKEVWVLIMLIMTSNSFFYPMICFPCIIIPTFFHWGIYHDKLSLWKSWFYLSHENLRITFCADMSLTFLMLFGRDFFNYFFTFVINLLPVVIAFGNIIWILCASLLTMCLGYLFISVKTIFIYCISSFNNVSNFLAKFLIF